MGIRTTTTRTTATMCGASGDGTFFLLIEVNSFGDYGGLLLAPCGSSSCRRRMSRTREGIACRLEENFSTRKMSVRKIR